MQTKQLELFPQTIIDEMEFEEIKIPIIDNSIFIGSANLSYDFGEFKRTNKIFFLKRSHNTSAINFETSDLHVVHYYYSYCNGIETDKNQRTFIVNSKEDAEFLRDQFNSKSDQRKKLLGQYGCEIYSID